MQSSVKYRALLETIFSGFLSNFSQHLFNFKYSHQNGLILVKRVMVFEFLVNSISFVVERGIPLGLYFIFDSSGSLGRLA